jgi:hypothetical protein
LLLLACGGPRQEDELGATCSAIVGGYPDTRYEAVAALKDAFGQTYCTATLVGFSAEDSVLLTAAHCLDASITRVAFGAKLPDASLELELVDAFAHPDFDKPTGELDFAIVLAKGQLPGVPALPILMPAEDSLTRGAAVEFVGYGETQVAPDNRVRNAVAGSIDTLTATTFGYKQSSGGPCWADSGGPAIVVSDGEARVAGVTSYGVGDCWARGVSGRASSAARFVQQYLDGPELCAGR